MSCVCKSLFVRLLQYTDWALYTLRLSSVVSINDVAIETDITPWRRVTLSLHAGVHWARGLDFGL